MTIEPSDDILAQHLLHAQAVSSEQLEAAQAEQALLSASGETMALSQVLVKQGVLTHDAVQDVEKSMPLGQNQMIGPYRLVRKLGEGGMGAVYLADDSLADRQVAIKILPKRYAGNADFLSRFRREAKSAGQLNHPNIVTAYTIGEDKGIHYYVMEYCDGEPLDKILKSFKRLTWDLAVNYTLQVARGLKHAHDKNIVHRDIKPGNIFITSTATAKILDMGLSKNIKDSEQSFNTVSGTALGTPHYISPEQAKGDREFDGRSDIYSLGATLYHLVTGTTPFQGATPAMVMMKHLTDQLPNPQDVCEDVPDGIVQVIQKMMAKEPDDRYASCDLLIHDLELVIQGRQPVYADVAEDKTSVGMRAVQRLSIEPAKHRKPAAMRSPVARIKAQPATHRSPAQRKSRAPVYVTIGTVVALFLMVSLVMFSGKKPKIVKPSASNSTLTDSDLTDPDTAAPPDAIPEPKTAAQQKDANTIFLEDFKHLDLDKLPPDMTVSNRNKLSFVKVAGHGTVLKINTEHIDTGLEPGLTVSLDPKKIRGRTILATVQIFCPNGFIPFHDATFYRPKLVSTLVDKAGKPFEHEALLQSDEHEWKQLVRVVKVPDDLTSLQFSIETKDVEGEVFFDDFKIEFVPDDKPTTIAVTPPPPPPVKLPKPVAAQTIDVPKKRFSIIEENRVRPDLVSVFAESTPFQNVFVSFDISPVCNADVITTATHDAIDTFKVDIQSSWTTASWLHAKDKKLEKKDSGIPDDGVVRIPKVSPGGLFQMSMPPKKSAIMLTPAKGRYPNPVTLQLPAAQRDKYAQIAFLHGGSWGDGRVRVLLHYSTGKDDILSLKIEDWHPQYRLPMERTEAMAVGTYTTHDRPAEMCAQTFPADSARVLESMTFTFEPLNPAAAEEVPHDDRFGAGIFAVSGLPASKVLSEPVPKEVPKVPPPKAPTAKEARDAAREAREAAKEARDAANEKALTLPPPVPVEKAPPAKK